MLIFLLLAQNIARTRTGRALQAIRDRDIAAEVMGVPEFRYKLVAFATSSFFAGVAGALFASHIGKLPATQFSLALSVEFIAILLIGGVGTVERHDDGHVLRGPDAQARRGVHRLALRQDDVGRHRRHRGRDGAHQGRAGRLRTRLGRDADTRVPLNVFDWNLVLYGVLIIVFLIFEPLGLYGIWVKIRNYWKRWPFSY